MISKYRQLYAAFLGVPVLGPPTPGMIPPGLDSFLEWWRLAVLWCRGFRSQSPSLLAR
jgi:hypothetical protein